MNILVAANIGQINPLIEYLYSTISDLSNFRFRIGTRHFWNVDSSIQIIHVHWPEALTRYVEPTDDLLNMVEDTLTKWKETTKILITHHNRFPHYKKSVNFDRLYKIIYALSDGIIHLSDYAMTEFETNCELYGIRRELLADIPQMVIPIPEPSYFPIRSNTKQAKHYLKLNANVQTISVVGTIRHEEEVQLCLRAFSYVPSDQKTLIIAGKSKVKEEVIRELFAEEYSPHELILTLGAIPNHLIHYYVNAGDLLFIPRHNVLNSANIALGFYFGKVVVGSSFGSIGYFLRLTSNPTFHPNSCDSLSRAIQLGFRMITTDLGIQNQIYADRNWSIYHVARKHIDFYHIISPVDLN